MDLVVEVKVHSSFIHSPIAGFKGKKSIAFGCKGEDLVKMLGIDKDYCFLMINGRLGHMDYLLKDGDKVEIFPVIIGG
ncbi:MoaD/ThiS family protein [Tepidimicrobium xylanilyticum]|uniref:Sulfur carrier protein ThiS (Thiamine biosynthesis) n=1 Tax=Tepidimicrobium xylanilyticum TaxID=1123352 RepID=A0A1H2QM69_9FIRM|nr:MoaD/ThiS family protein [Tepidimicrobium xylanilyticum]SDW08175.1 Sulfur carrier protein ThiS (thiamine biosynthesis) [Tepidimicrobium xylanilyticum]